MDKSKYDPYNFGRKIQVEFLITIKKWKLIICNISFELKKKKIVTHIIFLYYIIRF